MTVQDKAQEMADAINALAKVFLDRVPTTLASLEEQLQLIELDNQNHAPWKALHHTLHTMAGSAGMFDQAELGNRARALEIRINSFLKAEPVSVNELVAEHHAFIAWVRENI